MEPHKKYAIVMDNDPQVLKGLVLFLEGMQFKVISTCDQDDLHNITNSQTTPPALLLLPFEFDKGFSGIELVTRLRALFNHRVPAILLSHENGFSPDQFIEKDIAILSNRIKPRDLRQHISTILTDTVLI